MSRCDDPEFTQAVEATAPLPGCRFAFLLYCLRLAHDPPLRSPERVVWPEGTVISEFQLRDEEWPVTVDLFELHTPEVPCHLTSVLGQALTYMTSAGASLAWFMFDGAFGGINPVFGRWQAHQTYGIGLPGQPPELALDRPRRLSEDWFHVLTRTEDCALAALRRDRK